MDVKEASGVISPDAALRAVGDASGIQRLWSTLIKTMRRVQQPIIASIDGYALGGGLALALASDVRLATTRATFSVQMIRVGLTGCDVGISYHLPRAVGSSLAAEMMLTGNVVDAQRALASGLISGVFADAEELTTATERLAADMMRSDPDALRLTVEGMRLAAGAPSLEACTAIEDRQQALMIGSRTFADSMRMLAKRSKL